MKKLIGGKSKGMAWGLLTVLIYAGLSWAAIAPVPTYIGVIGAGLGGPGQAAVDFKNNLYVTYPYSQIVRIFSPEGVLTGTLGIAAAGGSLLDYPTCVAVDLAGKVFVGDGDRVVVLDPQNPNYIKYLGAGAGEFLAVQGITLYNPYNYDPQTEPDYMQPEAGNTSLILVADYLGGVGHIKAYRLVNNDYTLVATLNNLPFPGLCTGITVDNNAKTILITDKIKYKIFEYYLKDFVNPAPVPMRTYSYAGSGFSGKGKIPDLLGVAVDTAGRLYFARSYNSCVVAADRDNNGAILTNIGAPGTGNAQMLGPSGLLIDFHKRLIISDHENNRLVLFQLDAGPPTPFAAPDQPVLVDPLNKMVGNQPALSITNLYESNGNAVDYTIEVSLSQDFSSLAQTFTGSVVPPVLDATVSDWGGNALQLSQQYHWRARATNHILPQLASDWSEVGNFFVNTAQSDRAPSAPQLKAPANYSIVDGDSYLEWYPSTDPDAFDTVTYTVEILIKVRGGALVLITQGVVNSATGINLRDLPGYINLRQGAYYCWRVKAVDSFGVSSPYSEVRTFRVLRTAVNVRGLPGALVYIDGNDAYLGHLQGVIPANGVLMVELEPGRHVIRLQKAGYNPYYASVKVVRNVLSSLVASQRLVAVPLTNATLNLPQAVALPLGYQPQGARPFVVDWDDDGIKELLVGENNGNLNLLEPAAATTPKFLAPVLLANLGTAVAPFVVDWDNDGVKDILVGEGSGKLRRYARKEDLGTFNYTYLATFDNTEIAVPGPAVPWVVDWNGDGKKDLLVGAGDGSVYLFLNGDIGTDSNPQLMPQGKVQLTDRGTGTQTDLIAAAGLKNAAPLMFFWDTDGNLDLLVGYDDGRVYRFKNEPAAGNPQNPVFYGDAVTPVQARGGTDMKNYLGAGASPFVVIWKWGLNLKMDLLLGSDANGLWATMLNDL